MKVFISWSGEHSHEVALALSDWVENVLQSVTCWVSSEDIGKGTLSSQVIMEQLASTDVGIICLTRTNYDRPWVNFEAGAIAKQVGENQGATMTFWVDIEEESDVSGPLTLFQATRPNEHDVHLMMKAINGRSATPLEPPKLEAAVKKWWPDLDRTLGEISGNRDVNAQAVKATDREILEELLALTRNVNNRTSSGIMVPLEDAIAVANTGSVSSRSAQLDVITDLILNALAVEFNLEGVSIELHGDRFRVHLPSDASPGLMTQVAKIASAVNRGVGFSVSGNTLTTNVNLTAQPGSAI